MRSVESEINGIAGNIPVIHASSQATVESFHKPELLRIFEDRLLWSARRNTPWQSVVMSFRIVVLIAEEGVETKTLVRYSTVQLLRSVK